MNEGRATFRLIGLRIALLAAFVVLGAKLWQLQIGKGETYARMADTNRFRLVSVDPPRGVMYDRNGTILVRNIPSFSLAVVPSSLPEEEAELGALCDRLASLAAQAQQPAATSPWGPSAVQAAEGPVATLRADEIRAKIDGVLEQVSTGQLNANASVTILPNVSRELAFVAEEEHLNLPGVLVQIKPLRQYLHGPLTSHWLGYVGAIPAGQLDSYLAKEGADYERNDTVGLTGIELSFEEELRGSKGKKHVEVDAFEREVGLLATRDAQAGDSLILTLDVGLQAVAAQALQERLELVGASSGTVIVMNPQNGEVLAKVSLPSYDNNLFSGGITYEDYQRLVSDPLSPMLNHAIGGEYPPGSVFKIVPASAALEEGVITPRTTFTCGGIMWLPNQFFPNDPTQAQPFYCWRPAGHGVVNLRQGLMQSCDIYFYNVGGGFGDFKGLGLTRLADYARQFGFGAPTGINLPGEVAGLVPSERWKRENYDANWVTGDTYNMSIGQGYILSTPLQLLNAVAAVANGGTLYRPQVVRQVVDLDGQVVRDYQPQVIRHLPISDGNIQLVREGMRAAVQAGTAILLELDLPQIHAAGKTGTAEFPGERDAEGHLPTHAWFGAFAPYENPEVAIVVFLADGGQGALEAVPVASKILRHYFQVPEPTPTPKP